LPHARAYGALSTANGRATQAKTVLSPACGAAREFADQACADFGAFEGPLEGRRTVFRCTGCGAPECAGSARESEGSILEGRRTVFRCAGCGAPECAGSARESVGGILEGRRTVFRCTGCGAAECAGRARESGGGILASYKSDAHPNLPDRAPEIGPPIWQQKIHRPCSNA
jgi:hypothetical protein